MNKLISVIIPVFNVEKYLERCIKSIINQTYKNLEILLINDGSTDKSIEICHRYLEFDSRIILLNKENGGLSSARNLGIDKAKGEYISFVDSDDFIHELMYETLVSNLEKNDCDISIIESFDVIEDKDFIFELKNTNNSIVYSKEEAIANYLDGNFIPAWGKLYRKELFESIRFPIGILNEDEAIMIRVFDSCTRNIVYQDIKLYFYLRRKSGSITSTKKNLKNNIDWINNSYSNLIYIKNNYPKLIRKCEARYYNSIVAMLIRLVDLNSIEFNSEIYKYKRLLRVNNNKILRNSEVTLKFKIKCCLMALNINIYKFIRKIKFKNKIL